MLRQQVEEKNGLHPTVSTATPLAGSATLNPETAEAILETAAMLQKAEQNRLSVAEVQALAAKRGIAPHHVRQAFEMHGYPSARRTKLPPVRLTKMQLHVTVVALALCWLATVALPFYFPATRFFIALFPFLLAAILGFYLRYKRAGALVSVVLAAVGWSVISLGAYERNAHLTDDASWSLPFYFMALFLLLSVGGAMLRQWIAVRQLPYEPTVLKTSDLDR